MKKRNLTRRRFLRMASAGAGVFAAGVLNSGCTGRKRPNIILLLTDDQRWDALGAAGNPIIRTPNLDALARDGVIFRNAFVTTSICCTSRASIFLGQWACRHGIWDFATDFAPEQLQVTYHHVLREAGYRTGFIGKYGVGKNLPADDFDFWRGIPGQPKYEGTDENGRPIHLTRVMGDQAIEFLQGCSPEQPFCLSVSFKAPHVQDRDPRQFIYDPAYESLYKDVEIPTPETADEKYWELLPAFFRQDNEARRRWKLRFATPEMYQRSVKGYYRLIYGVDVVVGRIREQLQRQGLAENTVILFTSDNGFFLGEHGLAGKWYGYEESIRVPLIIFDPRLSRRRRGREVPAMALNVDIAPTILHLAGVSIPSPMQGRSLLPWLSGEVKEWRRQFLYEHLFDHPRIPKSEGVVTQKFKYLRYPEQQPVYEELFDREKDPHEVHNLAAKVDYRAILESLRKETDRLKWRCRTAE